MTDSYATLQVHNGTQRKYEQPITHAQQYVHIPSSWLGSRSGGYRAIKRYVTALGTMEVQKYSLERVEYGKVSYKGWLVLVVKDGTIWQAIDKKPINGCIA